MKKYLIIILSFLVLTFDLQAQTDKKGCEDHPLITRYPGSYIEWCDEQNFAEYKVATGPQVGYRFIKDWIETEGRVYRNYYVLEGERTVTEVYRNYQNAITKAGFEVLAKGVVEERNVGKGVGGTTFLGTFYASNPYPTEANILLGSGSSTSGGTFYVAARLKRAEGNIYVVVGGRQYAKGKLVFMVDIIEEEAMDDDLVTLDAEAMGRDIDFYGKVVLYGIYFDFDKATIKPESKPALDEIAKLLGERPGLSLYVVGHTDMKGTLPYNMNLSQLRATAVVEKLVTDYQVKRSRLEAKGVGPLVPVSTNQKDNGRAKNRRVELVQM